MAVDHYENFPVASILLPPALRAPIAAIYQFARQADDFADEGDLTPAQRLALLDGFRQELNMLTAIDASNKPSEHPVFRRLQPFVRQYQLPVSAFHDLLDAFCQDIVKTRYANYDELLDYCQRSAAPVGRLLLRLFDADSAHNLQRSDAICSALQLINHWQDIAIDFAKGRIYLPADDMQRFQVDEAQIESHRGDDRWTALMAFQVDRARKLMLSGAALGADLPGRIGLEIRAIVAGGLRILEKIEAVNYDIFRRRPQLGILDWNLILYRALTTRYR